MLTTPDRFLSANRHRAIAEILYKVSSFLHFFYIPTGVPHHLLPSTWGTVNVISASTLVGFQSCVNAASMSTRMSTVVEAPQRCIAAQLGTLQHLWTAVNTGDIDCHLQAPAHSTDATLLLVNTGDIRCHLQAPAHNTHSTLLPVNTGDICCHHECR